MGNRQGGKVSSFEPYHRPPSAVPGLRESVEEFIFDMEAYSKKTVAFYRDQVERVFCGWLEAHGVADVGEVTTELCRQYVRDQRQCGLAASSVEHRYQSAKRFLNWCVGQDWIDVNPMARVTAPKKPEQVRESFSQVELKRILHYVGLGAGWVRVRDRAMVITLLGTAFRADELCNLHIPNLDFANRLILVHGKGGKVKKVKMGRGVYKALRDWLRVRPKVPHDYVFVTIRRTPVTYHVLNKQLGFLGERCQIEDCIPHRFRHTAAVLFYRETRDLVATKGFLRHSNVSTTMRYLKGLGVDYETDAGFATPDELLGT